MGLISGNGESLLPPFGGHSGAALQVWSRYGMYLRAAGRYLGGTPGVSHGLVKHSRGLRKPVRTTREGIRFLQLYSIISVRFPVTRAQARGREIEANSLIFRPLAVSVPRRRSFLLSSTARAQPLRSCAPA